MIQFSVPCETLKRMAVVHSFFRANVTDAEKKELDAIRLENKNGLSFAVATNRRIAAIELLGSTQQPDGVCHVKLAPDVLTQIEKEAVYGSHAFFNVEHADCSSLLQTSLGSAFQNPCVWLDDTPLNNWRNWAEEPSNQPKGPFMMDLSDIDLLFKSSPTGEIVLPTVINVESSIVVRDRENPAWVGLFNGEQKNPPSPITPSELPDWWDR